MSALQLAWIMLARSRRDSDLATTSCLPRSGLFGRTPLAYILRPVLCLCLTCGRPPTKLRKNAATRRARFCAARRGLGAATCAGGRVNASIFLHLWIGSGVANHVVRAGSQSWLRLVLRALQTSRNLFGAACSRDFLCLGATDGEWSDIRSHRVCGRASYAAFRIAGNGDESSEREVCYCGD